MFSLVFLAAKVVRAFSVVVKTSPMVRFQLYMEELSLLSPHIDHERPRHGGVSAVPGHGLVQHQRPDGGPVTRPVR